MSPAPPARGRSLLPREHGVYAEVVFPLLTALALTRPSLSGLLLASGIVAAFLAHEPVLVLLGRRGTQARNHLGHRARRRLLILSLTGLLCLIAGLWSSGMRTRWTFAALLPVALLLGALVATRRHKSLFGESLVALLLSAAALPVALSCGIAFSTAVTVAATWATVFLLGTATVHALFARSRSGTRRPAVMISVVDCLLIVGVSTLASRGGSWWLLAPIPAALVSICMLGFGLSPKRLRLLGWALVLANLLTLAILTSVE